MTPTSPARRRRSRSARGSRAGSSWHRPRAGTRSSIRSGSRRRARPGRSSTRRRASSGMNSMKRTPKPVSRPKRARSTTSSSLTPRITTTLTFTGSRPASRAASMPASTSSSSSRRVSARKRSGRSVSSETLIRFEAGVASVAAMSRAGTPLVVIAMSSRRRAAPSIADQLAATFARTSGSPPVIRIVVDAVALDADPREPRDLLEA